MKKSEAIVASVAVTRFAYANITSVRKYPTPSAVVRGGRFHPLGNSGVYAMPHRRARLCVSVTCVLQAPVAEEPALSPRQPQPDYAPNRLEDDRWGDLGTAQIPVPENNRRLANRIPLQPVQPVRGLDLEQVPVGKQPVQADRGERFPPPRLVSPGRVRVGHAEIGRASC